MTPRSVQCVARFCKHFQGWKNGVPICAAFQTGIPRSIAYGNDLHLQPVDGDHGLLFEKLADGEAMQLDPGTGWTKT